MGYGWVSADITRDMIRNSVIRFTGSDVGKDSRHTVMSRGRDQGHHRHGHGLEKIIVQGQGHNTATTKEEEYATQTTK